MNITGPTVGCCSPQGLNAYVCQLSHIPKNCIFLTVRFERTKILEWKHKERLQRSVYLKSDRPAINRFKTFHLFQIKEVDI